MLVFVSKNVMSLKLEINSSQYKLSIVYIFVLTMLNRHYLLIWCDKYTSSFNTNFVADR